MIISIGDDKLKAEISTLGGTLLSLLDKAAGEELLWQADDPRSWPGRDVIIFPYVARLKDKSYTFGGCEYNMESHGLARSAEFEVRKQGKSFAEIGFSSDESTLKAYPFEFDFSLFYKISDGKLTVLFKVKNTGKNEMYFGVGAHPAYKVDCTKGDDEDDITGNYIIFDSPFEAQLYRTDCLGHFITGLEPFGTMQRIDLSKGFFKEYPTLILKGFSGGLTLIKRSGKRVRFELGNPTVLALWSYDSFGGYVCVEPWFGLPDFDPPVRELSRKAAINALKPGEIFAYSYSARPISK